MRYLNFSVDDEIYKMAKIDAVNEGKTTRQYLVDILTEHLNQKKKTKKQNVVTTTNQHNILNKNSERNLYIHYIITFRINQV